MPSFIILKGVFQSNQIGILEIEPELRTPYEKFPDQVIEAQPIAL
jgi:hypothetical protein